MSDVRLRFVEPGISIATYIVLLAPMCFILALVLASYLARHRRR